MMTLHRATIDCTSAGVSGGRGVVVAAGRCWGMNGRNITAFAAETIPVHASTEGSFVSCISGADLRASRDAWRTLRKVVAASGLNSEWNVTKRGTWLTGVWRIGCRMGAVRTRMAARVVRAAWLGMKEEGEAEEAEETPGGRS